MVLLRDVFTADVREKKRGRVKRRKEQKEEKTALIGWVRT